MIATYYYLDINPIGPVSVTALVVCVIITGLVLDDSWLPDNIKRYVKMLLPSLFIMGGMLCVPTKFVVGENIMGKLVCNVFLLACSLDLLRSKDWLSRTIGGLSLMASLIIWLNIFYHLLIRQWFYHMFSRSPVDFFVGVGLIIAHVVCLFLFSACQKKRRSVSTDDSGDKHE